MSTIMPQSELVRRAAAYINDTRKASPDARLSALIDDAAMRFNLSPLEAASLQRLFSPEAGTPVDPQS